MFSGSIFSLVACLALVWGQITPDPELPLLVEMSSTVNPEITHVLPQDDGSVEQMNSVIDETTEEPQDVDTTFTPRNSESQELAPEAVPMVPFFSDLAGAFGAHRLLAKRSLRALEPQRGDFVEKNAWYRLSQEAKGYPLVEPTEGSYPSQECMDRNTVDCNVLASTGYCDLSWTISLPVMKKMCSKACKFCQNTPDSELSLIHDDEAAEQTNNSIDETTQEPNVIDTKAILKISESQELSPDAAPMGPIFSDLSGSFGAHRLLAKRSLRALEPQRGDFVEKNAWYRLSQEAKGYPLVEGSNPSQECLDKNTKDCNVLAAKGYCDLSWTISLPVMKKMCSKACKFCQNTPDTQYPEKTFVLPQDDEPVEEMSNVIDETTEDSIPRSPEFTPEGAPMVPIFSDLSGSVGAHKLLAKHSMPVQIL